MLACVQELFLCLQAWRGHVARKEVQRRCAALGVITRMLPQIRAACNKCREDRRLRALAVAVVPIQAAVRGRRQRRLLQRQHQAAATIQAHFRGKLVRAATSHEVRPAVHVLLMPVQVDFFLVQCSQFTLASAFAHAVSVWGTGRCPMKLAISRGPKQKAPDIYTTNAISLWKWCLGWGEWTMYEATNKAVGCFSMLLCLLHRPSNHMLVQLVAPPLPIS